MARKKVRKKLKSKYFQLFKGKNNLEFNKADIDSHYRHRTDKIFLGEINN